MNSLTVSKFEHFAKTFYVYSCFRGMDGTIWESLKGVIDLYNKPYELDSWAQTTGFYGESYD